MTEPRPAPPFSVGFRSLLALGSLLRVGALLLRGAFSNSEAGLALNVVGRSFTEVARPFVYEQYAPYLYMASSKLAEILAGPSERTLRVLSLIAGCLLLPVMLLFVRMVSGWAAALFALAVLVPNASLLGFSAELGTAAVDALVSSMLCLLTLRLLTQRNPTRAAIGALAIVGMLAPWCSLSATFVLTSSMAALLVDAWNRDAPPANTLALPCALGLLWLFSFGVHFLAFLQSAPAYASAGQLPQPTWVAPHGLFAGLSWYADRFLELFEVFVVPLGFGLRYIAAALWAAGMVVLFRAQPAVCVLLGLPWILLALTASPERYVLSDRLALLLGAERYLPFMVPMIVTPVVAALQALAQLRGLQSQLLAAGMAVLLCTGPSRQLAQMLSKPASSSSIENVIRYLREQQRPGDKLYVERNAEWIYTFYARRAHFELAFPIPDDRLDEATPSFETLDALRGSSRVWVVVSTPETRWVTHEAILDSTKRIEALITARLNQFGRAVDVLDGGSTRLYLYDLSRPGQ